MSNRTLCKISYVFIICCILMYIGDILFWCHLPVRIRDSGFPLTFNSMMDHLLHGQFDVDPDIVGKEGFLRNGHVYAYWGIFPALLRLPVILLPNGLHIDVTRLSCATAAVFMFLINLQTVKYVTVNIIQSSSWIRKILFSAIGFSGVQICFLRPSLYQEVCLWALVFGMMFVHWAIRACLNINETPKALIWMSVASVGALLTRVSMGIGTYGAASILGIVFLWRCWRNPPSSSKEMMHHIRQCSVAVTILIIGLLLTAGINFERWGNPFTFANYNLYLYNSEYPDRIVRTAHYGLFNIQRIPLGLIYFFFPIWVIRNSENHFFFQDSFTRLLDAVELPPSSFFLTDGVFLLLGSIFIYFLIDRLLKNRFTDAMVSSFAVILGLTVPAILMLMAISMNYRYRAEFYPLIMFIGFMGAVFVSTGEFNKKWLKPLCIALVVIGIAFSNTILIIYNLSQHGPASDLITGGISNYYLSRFWHFI